MHNGPYWIGYDDEASLAIKAEFVNHLGIAGAFVWSIDTDDFNGENSDEPFPLMKTINRALVRLCLAESGFCSTGNTVYKNHRGILSSCYLFSDSIISPK